MSHTSRCRGCGQAFQPRPQNPTQTYCSQPACQRVRKHDWQRRQRASDPDYRANDHAAQQAWAREHPQYWRAWREQHPAYVARNRRAQGARNARRRAVGGIAKEDASTPKSILLAGTYRVEPWSGADCKWGRVNAGNLFILSAVATP